MGNGFNYNWPSNLDPVTNDSLGMSYAQPGAFLTMPPSTSATMAALGKPSGQSPGLSASPVPLANPIGAGVPGVAGAQAGGGFWKKIGGLEGLATIAQGIASLGQMYGAIQAVKLGKEQLAFQKDAFNTNLANQRQSYNTTLEDRIRSRYVMEGKSASDADSYLAAHKL